MDLEKKVKERKREKKRDILIERKEKIRRYRKIKSNEKIWFNINRKAKT